MDVTELLSQTVGPASLPFYTVVVVELLKRVFRKLGVDADVWTAIALLVAVVLYGMWASQNLEPMGGGALVVNIVFEGLLKIGATAVFLYDYLLGPLLARLGDKGGTPTQ